MKSIQVLSLGGTIAMTSGSGGVTPSLSAQDLVAAVPGLDTVARLQTHSLSLAPSASLTWTELAATARHATEAIAAGMDGVVVTQGTDTIEETGYFLDLALPGAAPVVITGAMRHPGQAGADGPANLLAAVQVAASPASRGAGVLVVLDDQIHSAARVRKVRTFGPAAFASAGGPIGAVVEGDARFFARPVAKREPLSFDLARLSEISVAVLPVAFSDDGRLLDAASDARLDGIVVEAFGAGHVPEVLVKKLKAVAARIPVVLSSRAGSGRVHSRTYGFPGSETDLLNGGLLNAGELNAAKARVLLCLLLASQVPRQDWVDWFDRAG
jgi:L-asparaginase